MAKKDNFVNFYQFLEIERNATIGDIKLAYMNKINTLTESLSHQKDGVTPEDIKLANKAFLTLSSSVSRYIHDCEIDGEEPDFGCDGEDYYKDANSPQNDLSEDENEWMKKWIRLMIQLYSNASRDSKARYANRTNGFSMEDFNEIINDFMQICTQLHKENKIQKRNSR